MDDFYRRESRLTGELFAAGGSCAVDAPIHWRKGHPNAPGMVVGHPKASG